MKLHKTRAQSIMKMSGNIFYYHIFRRIMWTFLHQKIDRNLEISVTNYKNKRLEAKEKNYRIFPCISRSVYKTSITFQ